PGIPHGKKSSVDHPPDDRLAADDLAHKLPSRRENGERPDNRTIQLEVGGTAAIRVLHPTMHDSNTNTGQDALPEVGAASRAAVPRLDRIMLGSNNYLRLPGHPEGAEATTAAVRRCGPESNGSRLLNGTMSLHEELEADISDWFGTEDARCFSTGHQTKLGT